MNQWFSYAALDHSGAVVRGQKLAASRQQVLHWLEQERLLLLKLREGHTVGYWLRNNLPGFRSSRDLSTLEALCSGLSVLLDANVLLPDALEILMSAGNRQVAQVAGRLYERLQAGQNLSSACAAEADVFGQLYPKLFAVGEATGDLAAVLKEVLHSARWQKNLRHRLSQVLAYPLLVLAVMTALLGFLLVYVVPQLLLFVNSVQQELPWYTIFLFRLSSFLVEHGWVVIAGLLACLLLPGIGMALFKPMLLRIDPVGWLTDRLWLVGALVRQIRLARYFHALAILSRSGVDYLDAMSQASQTLGSEGMEHRAGLMLVKINQGFCLSEAMRHCELFPQQVWRMIAVGERTGDLSPMFQHLAEHYDEDVSRCIAQIEQFVPPALVVGVGLVLMWIIVSVLGPLYDTMIDSGAALL